MALESAISNGSPRVPAAVLLDGATLTPDAVALIARSLGTGDLTALADIALALPGEGQVWRGDRAPSRARSCSSTPRTPPRPRCDRWSRPSQRRRCRSPAAWSRNSSLAPIAARRAHETMTALRVLIATGSTRATGD